MFDLISTLNLRITFGKETITASYSKAVEKGYRLS